MKFEVPWMQEHKPRPSTDADLTPFARAMEDLLKAYGAVRSYPINPSRADYYHEIEMAIRQMVKEIQANQ